MTGLSHATGSTRAYLDGLNSYERSCSMQTPTTDRVFALAAELGDPQQAYPGSLYLINGLRNAAKRAAGK